MKRRIVKAILSSLLMIVFLLMLLTGVLLFFGKTGMIWGFSRYTLRVMHFYMALFMCVLICIHLILNCKLFLSELSGLLKKRKK